jgi:hypothetical protein
MFNHNTNTNCDTNNDKSVSMDNIDAFLESEKKYNKTESWLKIDKTIKIQKLHDYADKYGIEHSLNPTEIESLKNVFNVSLDTNKLNKAKDVIYNKSESIITSIPALYFNTTSNRFTLKNTDSKRVSTVKSLTPKRNEKHRENIHIVDV